MLLMKASPLPVSVREVWVGTTHPLEMNANYGERGEKRELLIFTLRHRAHDFPTFSEFNFPSAYFEIFTVVRLESVGLVLKNASAPPGELRPLEKCRPPMHFFHFKISLFC